MSEERGSVAVVGLGNMGLPMARRLLAAGYGLVGVDDRPGRLLDLGAVGGRAGDLPDAAATGLVILMLPDSRAVSQVVEGSATYPGLAGLLAPGSLVIDMSSSEPGETVRLHGLLAEKEISFVDAPVSGGVVGAVAGTLSIMIGGDAEETGRARPVLEHLGGTLMATGGPGSGHAVKALNNLLSAAGLLAASEAVSIASRFGIETGLLIDVLNVSSGRSFSTEVKFPRFVIPETFDSGFGLPLMSKDVATAVHLADELGIPAPFAHLCRRMWAEAAGAMDATADHTEIARFVAAQDEGS